MKFVCHTCGLEVEAQSLGAGWLQEKLPDGTVRWFHRSCFDEAADDGS
jgi:hypothetical protein